MNADFSAIAHRPWPAPSGRWLMAMRWDNLLFAHWRVPVAKLKPHIPSRLELDVFDGEAWLGIVPFCMADTHLRGLPPLFGCGAFPELNVRTYVQRNGKPGVWFFSLDAASRVAVRAARTFFHLPYFDAAMNVQVDGNQIAYESRRTHRGAEAAAFRAVYRPTSDAYEVQPGTLEHWFIERYCLYSCDASGQLRCSEIHHAPWAVQRADAQITLNTMAACIGEDLASPPEYLHFSREQAVVAWRPVRCSARAG